MRFRKRTTEEPEINLVPMIDVLLMTLIFLVLTTSFAHESALKVELPQAHPQHPINARGVHIVIDGAGTFAVDGALVSGSERSIMRALKAHAHGPDTPVILYADRNAPYRAVVHALDAARRVGLGRIVFATKVHTPS
ncbi:biopolymer transporter ExbD [Acidiferrobacter sp.]|uniref:ExbD/TolR family protein n=1 Tax=Acidiferrobacter sp. TaxID=1872107 RepID=UPI0026323628|nr:biopolymer transporter ExbD [Acidiferrobacter sp.]